MRSPLALAVHRSQYSWAVLPLPPGFLQQSVLGLESADTPTLNAMSMCHHSVLQYQRPFQAPCSIVPGKHLRDARRSIRRTQRPKALDTAAEQAGYKVLLDPLAWSLVYTGKTALLGSSMLANVIVCLPTCHRFDGRISLPWKAYRWPLEAALAALKRYEKKQRKRNPLAVGSGYHSMQDTSSSNCWIRSGGNPCVSTPRLEAKR